MAGRALAFLLVADPPEPTAKEVAQALGVSKGALSPALGYLVRLHLVERFRRPGERADRYTVRPGAWRRILEEQARMLGRFRELAERGHRVADVADPGDARGVAHPHEAVVVSPALVRLPEEAEFV